MPASSVNGQTLTGRPRLVMVCQFKFIVQPFYVHNAGRRRARASIRAPSGDASSLCSPGHAGALEVAWQIATYYGPILCAMLCRLCPTQTQTMKQEKFGSSAHMRGRSPEVIRAYGEGFGLGFKALYGHDMDMERCLLTIPVRPLPWSTECLGHWQRLGKASPSREACHGSKICFRRQQHCTINASLGPTFSRFCKNSLPDKPVSLSGLPDTTMSPQPTGEDPHLKCNRACVVVSKPEPRSTPWILGYLIT